MAMTNTNLLTERALLYRAIERLQREISKIEKKTEAVRNKISDILEMIEKMLWPKLEKAAQEFAEAAENHEMCQNKDE